MRPREKTRAELLAHSIARYQTQNGALPGLNDRKRLTVFVEQLIDSLRRVEFAHHIRDARHDPSRMDPYSDIFDPLRAAVLRSRRGEIDEAWWLVFLGTHFGKHTVDGWRLARDVYGKLGQGGVWNWRAVSGDLPAFREWFENNEAVLRGGDGVSRRFGNHRKYESLKASAANGTANIFASYVAWVAPPRSHAYLLHELHRAVGQNPQAVFAALYESLDAVQRFGRLGKFDFLTMLGKLGIAPVDPGTTFLQGATGPLAGARLLFGDAHDVRLKASELETRLVDFGQETGLGSQVIEDALCNWQKSPDSYVRFRG